MWLSVLITLDMYSKEQMSQYNFTITDLDSFAIQLLNMYISIFFEEKNLKFHYFNKF